MRSTSFFLPLMAALATAAPSASAQSSYGPEISAEDFGQHLRALAATQPAEHAFGDQAQALRSAYVEYQFVRLGLQSLATGCGPDPGARQASLPDTGQDGRPTVYLAHWQDASEVAAVLEIAEHFSTQRPRPTHAVVFLFTDRKRQALEGCEPLASAKTVIEPRNLPTLDAGSLVRQLHLLHRRGALNAQRRRPSR